MTSTLKTEINAKQLRALLEWLEGSSNVTGSSMSGLRFAKIVKLNSIDKPFTPFEVIVGMSENDFTRERVHELFTVLGLIKK